ncbi:hypothetical protein [Streptomyces sp. B6B3]|uniref:hypothetical protein n=1 Tax=Streptomyces sp. B6B3 TaxID=3153570 RepID=UPI00325D4E00
MNAPAAPLPARPEWLPLPASGVTRLPTGRWFDAVVVDAFDGVLAIGRIQHRSGPVVEDQVADAVTWLVPVGTASAWRLAGVRVVGRGHEIHVPSPGWHGVVQWLIEPPAVGDCLTGPELLHDALTRVLGERRRWDAEGRRG